MSRYLVRVSGEIALKGSRRKLLEKILIENLESLVRECGNVRKIDSGRILVEGCSDISESIARVFGVHEVLEVDVIDFKNLEELSSFIGERFSGIIPGKRFAVRVRRIGSHSFTSIDVARIVGEALRRYGGLVDLEKPEIEVYVEIRGEKAFIYSSGRRVRGFGGLPLRSSENILLLFSGGFDSTVSAWLLMRRGSPVDLLYFKMGTLETMKRSLEVAEELLRRWSIGYNARVFIADIAETIREIRRKIKPAYWQISLKRSMYLIASEIAKKFGYKSIATGESIWEANSQTISNLIASSKNLDIMILRPVIGLSKDDIIRISREIGLYEKCERVPETCWLGSYVPVKVDEKSFLEEFNKLDQEIFRRTTEKIVEVNIYGDWREEIEKLYQGDIEIDRIPEDAVLIDITRKYVGKEIKGFRIYDLSMIEKFRDKPIILLCERGELSHVLAQEFRREGYRIYSLRGGFKILFGDSASEQDL
ncbi:MAG: THUMP domain-containing protein [Sulfolobales archaeon]